jgi:hypothetical protein
MTLSLSVLYKEEQFKDLTKKCNEVLIVGMLYYTMYLVSHALARPYSQTSEVWFKVYNAALLNWW